jgi:hypothetical protein
MVAVATGHVGAHPPATSLTQRELRRTSERCYRGLVADDAARERRERRRDWSIQRFGPGEADAMTEADAAFWLELPVEQRVAVAWQLSLEGHYLADGAVQRRLPRSAYRLVRR